MRKSLRVSWRALMTRWRRVGVTRRLAKQIITGEKIAVAKIVQALIFSSEVVFGLYGSGLASLEFA
jgi:hypothetical protein